VSRLRYLLAATLALAAVGVGVEHVLLAGAYPTLPAQPLPAQPVPMVVTGPQLAPPPPWAKLGPILAKGHANAQAAATAIERYAATHGHSYLGVTTARLRRYDPRLDASVHVVSTNATSYCVDSVVSGMEVSQSGPGSGPSRLACGLSA
jgi:hypothetical protein